MARPPKVMVNRTDNKPIFLRKSACDLCKKVKSTREAYHSADQIWNWNSFASVPSLSLLPDLWLMMRTFTESQIPTNFSAQMQLCTVTFHRCVTVKKGTERDSVTMKTSSSITLCLVSAQNFATRLAGSTFADIDGRYSFVTDLSRPPRFGCPCKKTSDRALDLRMLHDSK